MFIYTIAAAMISVIAGFFIAVRTKKAEDVIYGKLDKVGRITNIILSLVYIFLSPLYLFLGMICLPKHDGFLGILGWIVSIITASSGALFCSLGLGFSVALRKQGKSKRSFAVQFAGFFGILLTVLLYVVFSGNLLQSLN